MIEDRMRKEYSLVILGLIPVKQWHQRELDEAVQRPPVLRVAQIVKGPDDFQNSPRRVLSDALVVSREMGDELQYRRLDVRCEVMACRGKDGADSVYGDS